MLSAKQDGLIRTRVLDLRTIDVGEGEYVPLRVELLSGHTLVRIRARIRPAITWRDLVTHLFRTLRNHSTGGLPLDALRYTLVDMRTREPCSPVGLVAEAFSDHLLGIHHAEFTGALDRRRRMRLVADTLHALPWPHDQTEDESTRPPDALAAADEADGREQKIEAKGSQDEADVNLVIDEPALPAEAPADEPAGEEPTSASGGAWSRWHRTYAVPPGNRKD